jgi:hypothetical protein
MSSIPRTQQVIAVLWPSFITAGIATVIFFTAFDPAEILGEGLSPEVTRLGAYSVGFFLFWALTASTSLLTCYFQRPCERKGGPPVGGKAEDIR